MRFKDSTALANQIALQKQRKPALAIFVAKIPHFLTNPFLDKQKC